MRRMDHPLQFTRDDRGHRKTPGERGLDGSATGFHRETATRHRTELGTTAR